MGKFDFDVDIVLPWVDGSDPNWLKSRNKYLKNQQYGSVDSREQRYKDWGILKYLFRGISKYAPWINKVYFITCGQIPNWLNKNCEKLVIVNHNDYIPNKYLPTFSSHPIELNIHRIKDLSEHFIYFNDDTFLTDFIDKKDFFSKKGLPLLPAIEKPNAPFKDFVSSHVLNNNTYLINQKFSKNIVKRQNFKKWYLSGFIPCFINIFNNVFTPQHFVGFYFEHIPSAFLKSELQNCWEDFYEFLDSTSINKFRSINDVNQYLFRFYTICRGKFMPAKIKKLWKGTNYKKIKDIYNDIVKHKFKCLCLFDDDGLDNNEKAKILKEAFSIIFPNKSIFEK